MVFCCCDPFLEPEQEGSGSKQPRTSGGAYPGQRRLIKTAGNALADPAEHLTNNYNSYNTDNNDYNDYSISSVPSGETMVAVKIPAGVTGGDTIAVRSPDGKRTVNAVVPSGLSVGHSFMVRFPPSHNSNNKTNNFSEAPYHQPAKPVVQPGLAGPQQTPTFAQALDAFLTPLPDLQNPPPKATAAASGSAGGKSSLSPDGKHASEEAREEEMKSYSFSENVAQILNPDPPPPSEKAKPPINETSPTQKFLLVHVPVGTQPGATIHVQVPGENRTLAAEVPPGVTSFRVAYTPRKNHIPSATPLYPQHEEPQLNQSQESGNIGQKLLLVKVPPGTNAGATLHVSVPDEPGRILAAQIPPGNLRQFHVAYIPRNLQQNHAYHSNSTHQQNFIPVADPYNPDPETNFRASPTASAQPASTSPYHYNYNNRFNRPSYAQHHSAAYNPNYNGQNQQRQNEGGMSNYVLPAVGAAALGTAAFAAVEHFGHQDYIDGNDDGGDFDS